MKQVLLGFQMKKDSEGNSLARYHCRINLKYDASEIHSKKCVDLFQFGNNSVYVKFKM